MPPDQQPQCTVDPHTGRRTLICTYCHKPSELVNGDVIYPGRPDLYEKLFWFCDPCQAWVGCHPGTCNPLGRIANAELRRAKVAAHSAFDPIWKSGHMPRRKAYSWLSKQLGILPEQTHIGMFDAELCRRVVQVCQARAEKAKQTA